MSYEKVKEYFDQIGLSDRIVIRDYMADTVENAAQAIGCEPAHIAKTMSFMQNGSPVLVVMAGDAKVDNKKYKTHYHLKASMIPGDRLEDLVGHIPGAVCPFAINEGVKVDLDVSLKRFETVHTAGGSLNSTISLSPDELKQHIASANWVDVCKGWYIDEAE